MHILIVRLGEKVDAVYSLLKEKSTCGCINKDSLVPWLSKEDVIAHLRISNATYYNWRKKGVLQPITTQGEDRYTPCQINKIVLGRGYRERLRHNK